MACDYCGLEITVDGIFCETCFRAKGSMPKIEFMNWVKRVYMHSVSSISDKTVGILTDELCTTLIKCFMAQEDIMKHPEKQDAAYKAQELNARRNKLIRAIDACFGLENSYTPKTYG